MVHHIPAAEPRKTTDFAKNYQTVEGGAAALVAVEGGAAALVAVMSRHFFARARIEIG